MYLNDHGFAGNGRTGEVKPVAVAAGSVGIRTEGGEAVRESVVDDPRSLIVARKGRATVAAALLVDVNYGITVVSATMNRIGRPLARPSARRLTTVPITSRPS